MNAIFERRSVRQFTGQPVEPEKIERLLRAAMQAPSGGNQQPWEFVVVDNRQLLDALAEASPFTGPLKQAPLGIVVLARKEGLRIPHDVPFDIGAATQNLLLEAVDEGLGACWLGIYPVPERMAVVAQVLALPDSVEPCAMVAVGYPADSKQAVLRFDETRIHYNGY